MSHRNRNEQVSKDLEAAMVPADAMSGATKAVKQLATRAVNPVKRLSFFERQQAQDLNKALTPDGQHIDLSANSNTTSFPVRQRQNRNAITGQGGVEEMFGVGAPDKSEKSVRLRSDLKEGDIARCARYCKEPGRDNCPVCQGFGVQAFRKALKDRIAKG